MDQSFCWRKGVTGLLLLVVILLACNLYLLWLLVEQLPEPDERTRLAEPACTDLTDQGQIYVPAYSHIYQDGLPILMEVTLSLRNTDSRASITINHVDYFDYNGKLLRRFLKEPVILKPLMSVEYLIGADDFAGGMGANFLISWRSSQSTAPPLAEALMTGGEKGEWVSFGSRGEKREVGENGKPSGQG